MVKKLLSSLATLTLVAGSVTSTTAWTEYKNQNSGDTQKQKPQSSQNYNIANNTNFTKSSSVPADDSQQLYSYNGVVYSYGNVNADLYESFDNGKTWAKNQTIDPGALTYINLVYAYNNVVYVSVVGLLGNSGLYESKDNGKTFSKNTFNPGAGFIGSIYSYKNIVYLVSEGILFVNSAIWESKDNGKTWTKNTTITADPFLKVYIYAYNNVVYVGSEQGAFLLESDDDGKTFTENKSLPTSDTIYSIYAYNNVVYVGTESDGLWESKDDGKTFAKAPGTLSTARDIYSIYFSSNTFYVGTVAGLYESFDNGKTWTKNTSISSPYSINQIYAYNNFVYVIAENNAQDDFIDVSSDNGKTFTDCNGTEGAIYFTSIYSSDNIVYIASDEGVYESHILATVNQPDKNQNITNLGQTYNYLMYSNPINFTFDWTVLSKVTIVNNSTATPTTKTLTSGNYEIKDDGNYTVTFDFKDNTTAPYTQKFLLQNGYDYSQGLNMVTYDPATSMMDIYFTLSKLSLYYLENYWNLHPSSETGWLLYWIDSHVIKTETTTYKDLLSNSTLKNDINTNIAENLQKSFIPPQKPSPPPSSSFDLLNQQTTFPRGDEQTENNYGYGLQKKIKDLNPKKGLVFKIKLDNTRSIKESDNPSLGEIPLNPTTSREAQSFQTNYWDQILFNQN